ncbi:MAG: InlB B-repeat-containing protein [Paludibacteraceae bacterium]|nr:InlB B-repeat-containing protein [Paludibacteraceae bacterium]
MKKRLILFVIILNIISLNVWGDSFSINYYHKGTIVHTQQITQGSTIGSFPNLTLIACDDEINIFAGWINEIDASKYQTANTTTPTFITEEHIPTTDLNLYAVFADGKSTGELIWQRIKSRTELKDNDQIIITAHNHNYAIGKTVDKNNRLTAVEITKSDDKSTITPNNDVQIFTLKKNSDILWSLYTNKGYLGNMTAENSVKYYAEIKDWSSWGFSFETTSYATLISNQYNTHKYPYLYYNENSKYFACRNSSIANLTIYKQTSATTINYISCTTPDAVEYSITLHDNGNTSEIKCISNASIDQPQSTQNIKHWTFYGWATSSIEETTTTPEIISFPYTPTSNINLYAVYSNTTADSLIMSEKTIPANWKVNETRSDDNNLSLFSILKDKITIPTVENITKIEIEARKNSTDGDFFLLTPEPSIVPSDKKITSSYKTFPFEFYRPITSAITIQSSSTKKTEGVLVKNITIHHQPIYSSEIKEDIRHTISFESNNLDDQIKHYSISQSHGKNVKLPINTFTNGRDFLNWNTSEDGSGISYDDQEIIENITSDITLYAQWGRVETVDYNKMLEIDADTEIDRLIVKSQFDETGKIEILNNATLIVNKDIRLEKTIDGSRYYFFSLPFDCKINNIKATKENQEKIEYATDETSGDWVIAQYDQNTAAENAGDPTSNAWCEILDTNHTLKANRGYIVGYFGEEETIKLTFISSPNQTISTPNSTILTFEDDYKWYTEGEVESANGWNLIGSPFYQTIKEGTLTNFVTIPKTDGKTYTQCQYSDALKNGLITPFCSFFVQLAENSAPTITTQSVNNTPSSNYKSEIITISITNSTNKSDHTTIINNNDCTAEYEIGSDLKKWIGYADIPQIYTIENEIPLAYNSQKINHSTILSLGVYSPTEGEYTFTANKNYPNVYLFDKQNDITTNLAQSNYTTYLSQGIHNNRFEISFPKSTSTNLNIHNTKIKYFTQNGMVYITNLPQNAIIYIYDCNGKMIDKTVFDHYALPAKGLYHTIIMENDTKIDNFDVIY